MTLSFTTPRRFYPGALSKLLEGFQVMHIFRKGQFNAWFAGAPASQVKFA
jgi:hypothetical protein